VLPAAAAHGGVEGRQEAAADPDAAEVQAVLDACVHLRDRFLFALLYDSGCRIGEALGLRHEDIDAASRVLRIEPRANSNGARVKNHSERSVPVSGQLVRLWGDYLHEEYGDLDCDYVLSRCRDNTYCPEPGVIRMFSPEAGLEQAFFAGEVRIISWLYRLVIN
jgi:integrase